MYKYIQIEEDGRVKVWCGNEVVVKGEVKTIYIGDIETPEEPTDAVYSLYYDREKHQLYWVKVMEFDDIPPTAEEEQAAQMAYLVMKAKGSASV